MKCYLQCTCTQEISPWSIHQITVQLKQNHVCIAKNRAVSTEAWIWLQTHLRNADTCTWEPLSQSRWDPREGGEAALESPPPPTPTPALQQNCCWCKSLPPLRGSPSSKHIWPLSIHSDIHTALTVCQTLNGKPAGAEESKTLETSPLKAPVVLFGKGMHVGEI